MCRALALATMLALTLTNAATGQDARAWRDSLSRLGAAIGALRDSLVERDSTVVEIERRNGVVLSATPQDKAAASRAFQSFADQRARWFGSALPSPDGFRLVMQVFPSSDIFARFGERRTNAKLVLTGLPDTTGAVRDERASEPKELVSRMVAGFSEMMFPSLGLPTTRWLDAPLPLYLTDRDRRSLAMYMIMTSTGTSERGCIDGHLDLCEYALGLRVAPSSELTGAYPPMVRADLFLTALEIGGGEAWSRTVAAHPTSAALALEAASGLTLDSLLTRWHGGIIALRPDVGPLRLGPALLAAGWTGVLLLGALGASRWR